MNLTCWLVKSSLRGRNGQLLKSGIEKGELYGINCVLPLIRTLCRLPVVHSICTHLLIIWHLPLSFPLTVWLLCATAFHELHYWNLAKALEVASTRPVLLCLYFHVSPSGNFCLLPLIPSQDIYMLRVLQNAIQKPVSSGKFLWSSRLERALPFFELPEDHIWLLSYSTLYYRSVCCISDEI